MRVSVANSPGALTVTEVATCRLGAVALDAVHSWVLRRGQCLGPVTRKNGQIGVVLRPILDSLVLHNYSISMWPPSVKFVSAL